MDMLKAYLKFKAKTVKSNPGRLQNASAIIMTDLTTIMEKQIKKYIYIYISNSPTSAGN
jgi:hypothetical protein